MTTCRLECPHTEMTGPLTRDELSTGHAYQVLHKPCYAMMPREKNGSPEGAQRWQHLFRLQVPQASPQGA